MTTGPVISEFQAINNSTIADENGEFTDWLEIGNLDAFPVDLSGWYLTDNAASLTKWQFPAISIPAGDQLLVFASNKNRTNPLSELHTNFRLSGSGEYLALVEANGTSIAYEYAPQFPEQLTDVSYGLSADGSTVGFFLNPTPGTPNLVDPIADATKQIFITEIYYHPASELSAEEYIEIFNDGPDEVDLNGWSFNRGIDFVFPQVTLGAGEYLAVAADVPTFQTQHSSVTNVVGGWADAEGGKLSNRSEEIRLVDNVGGTIDRVTYADQGDWGVRAEGPNDGGFTGWVWEAEHDGGGKSLELVNLQVSNDFGQNWAASIDDEGTPGTVNSVATTNTAPLILDVIHGPAIPRSSDPVTITARIVDPTIDGGVAMLFWRVDGTASFNRSTMHDDGRHGDGAAGDSVYGATIPAQPDKTVVEFYVNASDAQGNIRTWPAPTQQTTPVQAIPLVEENAAARAFVPTDGSLGTSWTGGNEPFDDAAWASGTTGVGYESGLVEPAIALPIAYWPFDELTSGGTVAPDAGGRYDGTVSGAMLTTGGGGISGEALSFDGDDDYVLPGVISELVSPSAFSISLWFRRTMDHAGAAAETNHFVNNVLIAQSSNFSNDNLEIGTEADAVEVYLDTAELGGSIPPVSQAASIENDTWHHLVVSYDSGDANELKLYVDGALASQHSEYGGLVSSSDTSPFSIGLSRPGSSARGDFEGLIDDVAVWDVALDAQHVTALFAGTSPLLISGYEDAIGLDLQSALQNQTTSAFVRLPFTANGPDTFDVLRLRMRYDDAFVAYVNGMEVARAGVTGAVQWNSAADADRPDVEAFIADELNIANRSELLVEGQNMLAIQLLNFDAAAARALVLPELEAEPAAHETNALYQVFDAQAGEVIPLVEEGAAARAFVPTDDSLGTLWNGSNASFDDALWASGTSGVGYETGQVGAIIAAPIAYWTFDELQAGGTIAPDSRGRYDGAVSGATLTAGGGGKFGEALSFDGDDDYVLPGVISELANPSAFSISLWFRRAVDHAGAANETNHFVNNVLIAQSSNFSNDNLEIGTEGGAVEVYFDTAELGGSIPPLSQAASIQNDTWHHLVVSYDSGDANELKLYVDGALVSEHSEYGGLVSTTDSPFSIGVSRPGSSVWGDFEGLIDDVAVWDAALDTQHVASLFTGTSPLLLSGYQGLVGLDLQSALQNQNTSAYVRLPFTASGPETFDGLRLRMQYDDAFVAYVNGTEVARAGVTGAVQWNSAADTNRPDGDAVTAEQFYIANQPGLLVDGQNILAIQLLNSDVAATHALVLPQLEAVAGTPDPGSPSEYYEIMTAADRSQFTRINRSSNAQMDATFITVTDSGVDVRYNVGVRIRGQGSRGANPPNNRINLPHDRPWRGDSELNINAVGVANQISGSTFYRLARLEAADAQPVFLYSNGQNLMGTQPTSVYAHLESLSSEWAEKHHPSDSGGNLYRGERPSAGLSHLGSNQASYSSYNKLTNESEADWSDVVDLTDKLNNKSLDDIATAVNIDQWLGALGLSALMANGEGGLFTGDRSGDDYVMYRGLVDPRFQLVPHDLDTLFTGSSSSILPFLGVPALQRLVTHVDVLPEYGAKLWELANVMLSADVVTSALEQVMGPLSAQIGTVTSFMNNRRLFFDSQLLAPVSFSESGYVVPGTEVTLSVPSGTIYYTVDGTDPKDPGGAISQQATQFTGQPIVINQPTKIIARAYKASGSLTRFPSRWGGATVEDFVAAPDLVVSELNYNPHDSQPGELDSDKDEFEFVEVMNVGTNPIDLGGVKFVQVNVDGNAQGIDFTFASQTLNPGDRTVVVSNHAAFQSRYGTTIPIAAGIDDPVGASGEYVGRLSNVGERITLVGPSGVTLYSVDYNDTGRWPERPDGGGSSLELVGLSLDPNDASSWRGSVERGGSPGSEGMGNVDSVVINEVTTNNPGLLVDSVEFFNPTGAEIDIGGMWLSDNLANLDRYVIPASTFVPAGGYLVRNENHFGFGLNDLGEDVVLVDPGAGWNPDLFVDHVSVGPALTGESFGRWPDETGNLYPMITTTLGMANSGPRTGPLVISEVMYHPPNELLEFIEIYNPVPLTADLTGWTVEGTGYDFPMGTTIGPGQHLVLLPFDPATSTLVSAFNSAYDVDIAANLSSFLGPYPGRLDNGGETLTLRRLADAANPSSLVIEDQVVFDDMAPWPIEADGNGASLQRTPVDLWGNDSASWISANPTPGRFGPDLSFEFTAESTVIGEVGTVTDLTHEVQIITFSQPYTNPVVFAQPASFVGTDPVVVRVTNVQSNQFDMFLAEPSNLNGLHNAAETVSYVVLEAGSHWLSDGTHLEVGTVDTSAAVGTNIAFPAFATVNFTSFFAETPIVLSQTQTAAGELFLSTRLDTTTINLFNVALVPEEQFGPQHDEETVGYLAIDPGSGVWNEMPFLARVQNFVTQNFKFISFTGTTFDVLPSFLASLASYHGVDNTHLRFQNLDLNHVEVKLEEDTTLDEEMGHASENVAYLAIGGAGPLTAVSQPLADGLTQTFNLDIVDQGIVNDLDVNLELVHTSVGDLDIFLEAPDGTIVELLTDIGGSGDNFTATVLDDEAAETISSATPPYSGRFQPEGLLRNFHGKVITGTWVLHVTDDSVNGASGALLDWSLDIELAPVPEGNLNHDSHVDATDIDLLFANLGSDDFRFDVDSDGDVDRQDANHLVQNIMGKRFGDADLDQDVDVTDFNDVAVQYDPVGGNGFTGWNNGNFDGDDDVDFTDAMRVVLNFAPSGYTPVGARTLASASANVLPVDAESARTPHSNRVAQAETDARDASSPADVRQETGVQSVDVREQQVNHSSGEHLFVDFVDHVFRSRKRGQRVKPGTSA